MKVFVLIIYDTLGFNYSIFVSNIKDMEISMAHLHAQQKLHDDLTHCGWVMHICVSKLTIIGFDNGLSQVETSVKS